MGTRSIILIKRNTTVTRFYKHYDGYPTENLNVLFNSFSDLRSLNKKLIEAGARIDDKFKTTEVLTDEVLGNQWDLEWIYVVDLKNKKIDVYGGGYFNCSPLEHVQKGPVNPVAYSENLIDEYQADEKKLIIKAMSDLAGIGFKINEAA
jgi:hypothetical protein